MREKLSRFGLPVLAVFLLVQGLWTGDRAYFFLTALSAALWGSVLLYRPSELLKDDQEDVGG